MRRLYSLSKIVAIGALVAAMGLGGCTKRPSEEQLAKLDEARQAAEAAEKKLAELRSERMQLESALAEKQAELARHEEERDDLKIKMGQE
ncbi:MAG: hypothetical protein GF398_16355 [Chitinivibrionales bacterium]|nr:hypothetical protein [Chitinivibrionales bacterium]